VSRAIRDIDVRALSAWPLPEPGGDKDARGRVVVVGGSRRTPGAVLLAAEAAVRAGAGKPQLGTVASVAVDASVAMPEALVTGLAETSDGELGPEAAPSIMELAADCDALLLGPGLLSPEHACDLLEAVVPRLDCPLVVDALGMAYLTKHLDGVRHLAGRVILTPNVTELATTLGQDEDRVSEDPGTYCLDLAERTGAVVVAGGAETFVAADGGSVLWRHRGVPGLGVAGSGDVKAGLVAGLLARGVPAEGAAIWGVALHQAAGREVTAQVGPVGFLAREVLPEVPAQMARLASRSQ
jgi:hydroxyethylthiazole kinase-like uncharacterized protein yjeF